MKNKSIYIPLTGGLGNQLFQLSAALNQTENVVYLISNIGIPRTNSYGEPEIFDFALPNNVKLYTISDKRARALRKIFSFAIRYSSSLIHTKFPYLFNSFVRIFLDPVISVLLQQRVRYFVNVGVGFSHVKKNSNFLMGYFQSYVYSCNRSISEKLYALQPKILNSELLDFQRNWEIQKNLLVHVRLGDYRNHPQFGIPSKRYYEKAIELMIQKYDFDSIYLFSDEPDNAMDFIPQRFRYLVKAAGKVSDKSACVLECMRYAHGYVIANSTFSWWAAYLSYTPSPPVVIPSPWFKELEDPEKIAPPNWIKISAK